MDDQTWKIAEEIAILREEQEMTFSAIGMKYNISSNKASYLYHRLLRKRRIARYQELYAAQNQTEITLSLTLGEGVVLQRILSHFQQHMIRKNARKDTTTYLFCNDPDYATAENLRSRLSDIEQEIRNRDRVRK